MTSPFSVIMSVYKNDRAEYVSTAIDSIIQYQTIKPNEVILVVDGPINDDLIGLLLQYERKYEKIMKILWQKVNTGLGNVLRIGVENAKYDIIARMDSDDISRSDRFEKQIKFMSENPDVDLVGGQIDEFIDSEDNVVGKRVVPVGNTEIYKYIKSRCPFNHMTVMFRKSAVLNVGNYKDWHYNEDYYLWIRMALAKCIFANMPDTLANVRVSNDMYKRRGGRKYFKSEAGIQIYMWRHGMISFVRAVSNILIRFVIQILMPNRLRGMIFRKLFRK